jgi:hypothetical protein
MLLRRALRRVWFAIFAAATITLVFGSFYFDHLMPFDLDRPPNFLTKYHLQILKAQPDRCTAALERANIEFQPALPEERDNGCGYDDGVRLLKSDIDYGSRILLRCPAMLALLSWERHVLAPKAEEHFGRKLASTAQLGTYVCRAIGGRKGRRLSQHAYANAIDISGFTLEGGERISVLRDWKDEGAKGRFLRDVRDGACRYFGATLSPDFNAAHANHFHLDMGAIRICR